MPTITYIDGPPATIPGARPLSTSRLAVAAGGSRPPQHDSPVPCPGEDEQGEQSGGADGRHAQERALPPSREGAEPLEAIARALEEQRRSVIATSSPSSNSG